MLRDDRDPTGRRRRSRRPAPRLEISNAINLVAAARRGLYDAMRAALIAAVEGALTRRVRSFTSAYDLKRHLQVEVFVLDAVDATRSD